MTNTAHPERVHISELMRNCGVKFGTSGARGLVSEMTDRICYAYSKGFIGFLEVQGLVAADKRSVALAGDLRPSTPRILAAVAKAVADCGYNVIHCGRIPSPAVALYGMRTGIPTIMVTGSHIPDDRNGIKFTKPEGEVLKEDENVMLEQRVDIPALFNPDGMLREPFAMPAMDVAARDRYVRRYLDAFPANGLSGFRIGVYEHSAVGRDLLCTVLEALGARIERLGRSETFIPVDTEAIRSEDVALAEAWAGMGAFDALVSTDGDSDRPLISDEHGKWLRGDVAGILCARFLKADVVAVPVSCNTAVERCGAFKKVLRTRIGSPYVIASMQEALASGATAVVGYEANGGFLSASPLPIPGGGLLAPLPTRDPVIVMLAILCDARRRGLTVFGLQADLPSRFTHSDRLEAIPLALSHARIAGLASGGAAAIEAALPFCGNVANLDQTDGLRATFESGEVVHLRPSGNAPELRCYTEADTEARARELNLRVLDVLRTWMKPRA